MEEAGSPASAPPPDEEPHQSLTAQLEEAVETDEAPQDDQLALQPEQCVSQEEPITSHEEQLGSQNEEFTYQEEQPVSQEEQAEFQQEEIIPQQDENLISQETIMEPVELVSDTFPVEEMQVDEPVYEAEPEFSDDFIDSDLLIIKPKVQQVDAVVESEATEPVSNVELPTSPILEETLNTDETEITQDQIEDNNECAVITVTEQFIHDAQLQLTNAVLELERTQECLRNQEVNSECYRQQRDSAIEERNSLMDMISRLNSEIGYLKDIHTKNLSQLKSAISQNCEIVSKGEELKTKELALKYREELMDQERKILNDRILTLTSNLNKSNFELETCQIKQSSKISTLEIQLAGKSEELDIANDNISYLRGERIKLIQEVENLSQKLQDQHEIDSKNCDELRKKLNAKCKVADLYKNMRDDSNDKCEELMTGVAELQKLLNEAVQKYGELENKNIQTELDHESLIKQKNDTINALNVKIEETESQLKKVKAESVNLGLMQLSPTATIVREFLKSGMSLAEIYNQWVRFSDELTKKTDENNCLKDALTTAVNALENNAPIISNQTLQYEKIMDDNTIITQQMEAVDLEYSQLKDDYSESLKVCNHYERENIRLREELTDLSNQVCFLLKEIEINRGGNFGSSRNELASSFTSENNASQLITKNLVTFSDIQEIQSNNKKLLKIIRELTNKQEEDDVLKDQIESGELQSKLELLGDKVAELQGSKDRLSKTISGLITQRDMYKKLYHNKLGSNDQSMNDSNEVKDNPNDTNSSENKFDKTTLSNEYKMLEQQLDETRKLLNQQKEDYKKYENLSDSKEKLLITQADKLRKELSDLNDTYRKCYCSLETHIEKNKNLQNDLNMNRNKVSVLEDRNEKYNSKIAEHEMSIKYLREKMNNLNSKLSKTEVMVTNLQKECQFLTNNNNQLLSEKEQLSEDLQEQTMLLSNLQVIKDIIEKKKYDDNTRLGTQLDEFSRECSLLHRKLQEKQDKFSELFSIQTHQYRTEEENLKLQNLQLELSNAREDLENKNRFIDELNIKLSIYDGENVKDLKNQLNDRQLEIVALQKQLNDSQNHMNQFSKISEGAEGELKTLSDQFNQYRLISETQLTNTQALLEEYKEKCAELETELSLQNTNELRMTEANEEIKEISLQLSEKASNLEEAYEKIDKLIEDLQLAEQKYDEVNEICKENHKEMSQLKSAFIHLHEVITDLKFKNINMEKSHVEFKSITENDKQKLISEKNDIETQIVDLREQNSLLHDEIDLLTSQISLSQSTRQLENPNESLIGDKTLNTSSSEDDLKSISQLMQVIKFLRKERDIYISKYNGICDENLQIKSQLELAEIKVKENIQGRKDNSNSSMLKHSEIMQKVQSVNTITHNNVLLREERDGLLSRVKEMTDTIKRLEESLSTLQDSNNEIVKENNALTTKNTCVQVECSRWKGRVNTLTEKANKTNPEDWKRLQTERETLAKMLTNEKENVKKLRDESVHSKLEKSKLEEQYNLINKQHGTLTEDVKRQSNEIAAFRRDINQLTAELTEAKSLILSKTEENKKLQDDVKSVSALILESRNKESQIRKIAKQYKSQFEELSKNVEEEKKKAELRVVTSEPSENANVSDVYEQRISQMEKTNLEQQVELTSQITSLSEENNTFTREIELLKNKIQDTEDRARQGLKQAKTKIIHLTETKENLAKELNEANAKIELFEQNKDETDDRLTALKSQYEGRIVKLEKEKVQAQQELNNETIQLNKQIESLTQKIAQMQKQIDNQIMTKPSVSANQGEKPVNEPPTANIKPMSGSQQSIGIRRTTGDTPLASIRPMTSVAGIRTAAVLPNAQYSTASNIHHHTHTASNTAGDSNVTLPSIAHVAEYAPSSSSIAMRHSPCSNQTPMESSQDTDSNMTEKSDTNVTVALVTPRIESSALDSLASQAANQQHVTTVSGSSIIATTSVSSIGPVSRTSDNGNTSNNQKRTRGEEPENKPNSKRLRTQKTNENEAEYQVPTSSQKDQDDSVIVVDSDEEDESQYEDPSLYEYNAEEVDDENEEEEEEDDDDDDDDEVEEEENEEEEADDEEMADDEEVIESEMVPAEEVINNKDESSRVEQNNDDDVECREVIDEDEEEEVEEEEDEVDDGSESAVSSDHDSIENDDNLVIDTMEIVSTNNETNDDTTGYQRNQDIPISRPNSGRTHHGNEMSIQTGRSENFMAHRSSANNAGGSVTYEEPDDGIVPSTPILFLPAKNEGYGDNVRSPSTRETADAQFSFANNAVVDEMDNTHADLTPQLESRLPSTTAQMGVNIDTAKESENSQSANDISGTVQVEEGHPEDTDSKLD